ncbi:MAG TPA: hypothetical protein VFR97_11555 [Capillimicrobium sp.]|nr:hypothetical protein [Capillimicrobium sp.]
MRPSYVPRSDLVSYAGRAAHDLGLAGMLGGQLFGRLALHPSVTAIGDEAQRGAVVNAAWRRYGTVNSLALLSVTGGWLGARSTGEARDDLLTPRERTLARVKDALVAATFVTGAASALQGVRFARMAPGGAVPLRDGDHVAPRATEREARAKRRLNLLGAASIAVELGLVVVNAALEQAGHRRAPLRRWLRRGG